MILDRLRFFQFDPDSKPGLPDPALQENLPGQHGDATLREAFAPYKIFKRQYEKHVGPIGDCPNILDFGCGWGRIIRFFLKDVPPEKLFGIDHSQEMISICHATNKWCRFSVNSAKPPSEFSAESFGLIYLYSVFSHLPEVMHLAWLAEFRRILCPGGLLIGTTFPRSFIQLCESLRADPELASKPQWLKDSAKAFPDVKGALARCIQTTCR